MPSMLEPFIPRPHVVERDRVAVVADVPVSWDAIRHLDASRSRFVRALFALRHLPDLVNGRLTEPGDDGADSPSLDDLGHPGQDFQLLADEPGRGFVVGAIARFGQPSLEVRAVAPDAFGAFSEPGYGKLVWGLSVEKRQSGGSWVTFELRVALTDAASQEAFDRVWKVVAPFMHGIRTVVLGLLEKQLEAIEFEHMALPGDLLMPARFTRTMGVVIEAPPAAVWPWLLQLGKDRAGWYDGEREDASLHPEWQRLEVGQLLEPKHGSPLAVKVIEPERALVLGSPGLSRTGPRLVEAGEEPDFKLTWAFVLEPIGDEACWLGTRVRAETAWGLEVALRRGWDVVGHQVLQRTQLQNIKARVERRAA